MKKYFLILCAVIVSSFLFFGCQGEPGAAGPAGADGVKNMLMMNFQNDVYPSTDYTGNVDNTITSGTPDTNRGSLSNLYTGYYSGATWHVERVPMKFEISQDMPANAKVKKVYLTLFLDQLFDISSIDTTCYKITTDWTEGSSTWNDPWTDSGGDYGSAISDNVVMETADNGTYITWKLDASEVQAWLDNPSSNYGFLMKSSSEDTGETIFNSSETGTEKERPKLTVYYTVE